MTTAVPLTKRLATYREAESAAERCAETWLESRATDRATREHNDELDEAMRVLRAAKSRYEKTLRREAKS